jgi:hypothetical protein
VHCFLRSAAYFVAAQKGSSVKDAGIADSMAAMKLAMAMGTAKAGLGLTTSHMATIVVTMTKHKGSTMLTGGVTMIATTAHGHRLMCKSLCTVTVMDGFVSPFAMPNDTRITVAAGKPSATTGWQSHLPAFSFCGQI